MRQQCDFCGFPDLEIEEEVDYGSGERKWFCADSNACHARLGIGLRWRFGFRDDTFGNPWRNRCAVCTHPMHHNPCSREGVRYRLVDGVARGEEATCGCRYGHIVEPEEPSSVFDGLLQWATAKNLNMLRDGERGAGAITEYDLRALFLRDHYRQRRPLDTTRHPKGEPHAPTT